jgi:predicted TPR repeat methyltransferase
MPRDELSSPGPMNHAEQRSPRLAVVRASAMQRAGQLDAAEALLREALLREPGLADAVHLLGLLRYQRGDLAEAQQLVGRAVELDPVSADAWRNLGNLCGESGALDRAEACFRRVLQLRAGDVPARGNLAMLLERSGRIDEALGELRELRRLAPTDIGALSLLARLLRVRRHHEEEVTVARELVRLRPGDAALRRALSRSYFLWFDSVDRDREKAQSVLAEWAAFDDADPIARHMLAAHLGKGVPPRATDGYVERHFDEFAATFDDVLGALQYRGPELVEQALRLADPTPRACHVVADLGCGTGRCGPLVRPWARTLAGVDLAQKMLDAARRRGGYDQLVHQEVTAFLEGRPDAFDLVVCADMLPYFGDLGPLFAALARALTPGGRFIATVELLDGAPTETGRTFELLVAGRYAHHADYVTSTLEALGLTVEHRAPADLRMEHGRFTKALVVTARREPAPRRP